MEEGKKTELPQLESGHRHLSIEGLCWLVYVILTQKRVILKEGLSVEKMPLPYFPVARLWSMFLVND